jgi:hypothetical protein
MTRIDKKLTSLRFRLGVGLIVLLVGIFGLRETSVAQTGPRSSVGLGGQLGDPAGVTLKFRNPAGVSYDFMAAWDSGDFFFLNGHGLIESQIGRHRNVHAFYGPGAFVGLREHGRTRHDDEGVAGISATVGLGVILEQFELFGQLIPRLELAPATEGDLGIGVGVRYYF